MGLKTDAETPSKVASIIIQKNTFSMNKFKMLTITDRQVKSTLEMMIHIKLWHIWNSGEIQLFSGITVN